MKALELFSGIGGIALAAEWAGIETVAFCERDLFCQKVLNKHWPSVPIFDDIKTLNKQRLIERGVDVGAIELISGGFPCQPYSIAGKRKGTEDDRDLWPEMFRIIEEIGPTWVAGENVANFANMELDRTLSDLESIGYKGESFIIPACSIGALHRRDRTFFVAYSNSNRLQRLQQQKIQRKSTLYGNKNSRGFEDIERRPMSYEPKLSRSLARIPNGVDRVRSLGNAVVPQQIYPIFEAIMKVNKRDCLGVIT